MEVSPGLIQKLFTFCLKCRQIIPNYCFLYLLINFHHCLFVFSDMTLGGQSWSGPSSWLTTPIGSMYHLLLSQFPIYTGSLVWVASFMCEMFFVAN
jgi:hypothetical protein